MPINHLSSCSSDAAGFLLQHTNGRASDSPDGGEEAGASSGESNTREQGQQQQHQGAGAKQQGGREQPAVSANPSCQTSLEAAKPQQEQQQLQQLHSGGSKEGCKAAKLPRPQGAAHCPRCASEDTKFCYYNNYNVKQPRYFCKVCVCHGL